MAEIFAKREGKQIEDGDYKPINLILSPNSLDTKIFRLTSETLWDARSLSEFAGKKAIDDADVQFAIDNCRMYCSVHFLLHFFSW